MSPASFLSSIAEIFSNSSIERGIFNLSLIFTYTPIVTPHFINAQLFSINNLGCLRGVYLIFSMLVTRGDKLKYADFDLMIMSSLKTFDNLESAFEDYCRTSSLIYETEEGWIAIVQPLDFLFSYRSNPYKKREQAWLKTRLMLGAPFFGILCKHNAGLLIVVADSEEILCGSSDFMKSFGVPLNLNSKEYINNFLLPPEINKTDFIRMEIKPYLDEIKLIFKDLIIDELNIEKQKFFLLHFGKNLEIKIHV